MILHYFILLFPVNLCTVVGEGREEQHSSKQRAALVPPSCCTKDVGSGKVPSSRERRLLAGAAVALPAARLPKAHAEQTAQQHGEVSLCVIPLLWLWRSSIVQRTRGAMPAALLWGSHSIAL